MKPLTLASFALLLLTTAPSAFAQDATVTVNGRILPGTCNLSNANVVLDEVRADLIPDAAEYQQSRKGFSLEFTGCAGVTRATVTPVALAADENSSLFKNTAANPASGVGLAIRIPSPAALVVPNVARTWNITGASLSIAMQASYYGIAGPKSAGDVGANITLDVSYE